MVPTVVGGADEATYCDEPVDLEYGRQVLLVVPLVEFAIPALDRVRLHEQDLALHQLPPGTQTAGASSRQ
jgi:hypothetical protein